MDRRLLNNIFQSFSSYLEVDIMRFQFSNFFQKNGWIQPFFGYFEDFGEKLQFFLKKSFFHNISFRSTEKSFNPFYFFFPVKVETPYFSTVVISLQLVHYFGAVERLKPSGKALFFISEIDFKKRRS